MLFGFLGGWLVFRLFTSIVLYITWLKGRKGVVQILSILLFPITIMIALFAGIGGCFLCLIYNIATGKGGFAHKNDERNLYAKQHMIQNVCFFVTFLLSIVIIVVLREIKTLLPFILIEGSLCIVMVMIISKYNHGVEKKINEILLLECDAKKYVELMEYGAAICSSNAEIRINGRKIRQVLGYFLCGEDEKGIEILENLPSNHMKYRIDEQKYFFAVQIIKCLLLNELENIEGYVEQYTNAKESIVKKEFWKCAILFKEKKYDELELVISQLENMDIVLLKQYIAYMWAEIFEKKGELNMAKEKRKFICENGGTLKIANVCREKYSE